MIKDMMDFIMAHDPEIGEAVKHEFERQRRNIELIASENFVSEAVLAAAGSVLTNKYAEGYPSKRYYGGCQCVDVVENLARERACKLFGADHANVQDVYKRQGPCGELCGGLLPDGLVQVPPDPGIYGGPSDLGAGLQ